jgi:uncharacterized protein YecT (DUF1311 family)
MIDKILSLCALIGCAAMISLSPAMADDAYDKCINESDGTNTAWGECGGAFMKRADDALNVTWKRVYALTDGDTKTALLAEQRLWVAFKEGACQFYASGDFGREGQVLSYPACQASIIEDRTTALEGYEDDFSPR